MKKLGLSKRKCLICEEKEKKDFKSCETEDCNATYCEECYIDIGVSFLKVTVYHHSLYVYFYFVYIYISLPRLTYVFNENYIYRRLVFERPFFFRDQLPSNFHSLGFSDAVLRLS